MSDHEVSPRDREGITSDRVEQFLADVYELRLPSQTERRERRLLAAGVVITLAGFAVIGLGWWGASGTKYVYQEIPYVVSGGIFGTALVIVGAALFARYSAARLLRFWLARLVADQQTQTDRVVDAIDALADSMRTQRTASDDEAS
jgi:hypothetical protein